MGFFNNSKFKVDKRKEKKDGYRYEPEKNTEQKSTLPVDPIAAKEANKEQQQIKKFETAKEDVKESKPVDPYLEFQMRYGLEEELPRERFFSKTLIKPLIQKELTIILLENTTTVGKEKENVLKIVQSFTNTDLMCIINYGTTVRQGKIFDVPASSVPVISYNEMTGEKACLFDALIQVEKIVKSKYSSIEDNAKERVKINNIQIIGIGTCRDNASVASKEEALSSFYETTSKTKVTSKYFCISDKYFTSAAEIGFHSIGAISRNFQ